VDGVGEDSVVSIEEENDHEGEGCRSRKLDQRPHLARKLATSTTANAFCCGSRGTVGLGKSGRLTMRRVTMVGEIGY
jgi:hypothetical protein